MYSRSQKDGRRYRSTGSRVAYRWKRSRRVFEGTACSSFLVTVKGIYKANMYFNNPSGSGIFIFLDENIGFITFWSTFFFFLKNYKLKLQEAIVQEEEATQMCARELYALIDSVSKYKEYMASKILEMKRALSETVGSVSDLYKGSLTAQIGSL